MTRIEANLDVLEQLCSVATKLEDSCWTRPAGNLRIGPHVRHVIEFYQCFLDGLDRGEIDYDSRRRNANIENSRPAALRALKSVREQLREVSRVRLDIEIRVCEDEASLQSTVGRELSCLLNHTIHHMALIAIALNLFGVRVDRTFGVAPSTLRYREQAGAAA
jgi:uncharacterized damage-inducible protein DinB